METVLYDLRASLEEVILLRTLSVQDALTGLYNRGYFNELLQREWHRARRDHLDLTIVMVDVDHFKAYNGQFGHQAGDRALKAVAARLRERFQRPSDVVARYGGEEFVVLLPTRPRSTPIASPATPSPVSTTCASPRPAHQADTAGRDIALLAERHLVILNP